MRHSEAVLMDCMEYMSKFPDKFFDIAIVDPPYGINVPKMQMGHNPKRSRDDGHGGPGESVAVRLRRGSDTELDWDNDIPLPEYFAELMRVSKHQIIWGGNYFPLPQVRGWIIWDKKQPWDNFSQVEMAWTSIDMPAKLISISNTGGANNDNKIHPTQKQLFTIIVTV